MGATFRADEYLYLLGNGCANGCYGLYRLVGNDRYIAAMIALALLASPALCLATVHDGDTVRSCDGERIRIANIDAPELRGSPKCRRRNGRGWCDYALAERSRDALAAFLASGRVTIRRSGTDRYGRTLATLAVDGRDAGAYLIKQHLARPWR